MKWLVALGKLRALAVRRLIAEMNVRPKAKRSIKHTLQRQPFLERKVRRAAGLVVHESNMHLDIRHTLQAQTTAQEEWRKILFKRSSPFGRRSWF